MGVSIKYSTRALRAAYKQGGLKGVQEKFGMSVNAARVICTRRGIHEPREYQRQPSTPFLDEAIKKAYESGESQQVKMVAERYSVKYGWIRWRAMQLGCRNCALKHEPLWSDAEIELLEELQGYTVTTIQRRFKAAGFIRTRGAISSKQQVLGIKQQHEEGYTALDVAGLMGVNSTTVCRWIKNGLIKCKRQRYTPAALDEEAKQWFITPSALRTFIIENIALIDFRKLVRTKEWFISILTDNDLIYMQSDRRSKEKARAGN